MGSGRLPKAYCRVLNMGRIGTEELMGPVLANRTKSMKLVCGIDTASFASILVVLAMTVMFAIWILPAHHVSGPDLAKVVHPIRMPGASREGALLITITRDGRAYFGFEQINAVDLPAKIQDRLKDLGVERKVYIAVDERAWWVAVEPVLNAVRSAGIIRVACLSE